jgi:hypothetical protein
VRGTVGLAQAVNIRLKTLTPNPAIATCRGLPVMFHTDLDTVLLLIDWQEMKRRSRNA